MSDSLSPEQQAIVMLEEAQGEMGTAIETLKSGGSLGTVGQAMRDADHCLRVAIDFDMPRIIAARQAARRAKVTCMCGKLTGTHVADDGLERTDCCAAH